MRVSSLTLTDSEGKFITLGEPVEASITVPIMPQRSGFLRKVSTITGGRGPMLSAVFSPPKRVWAGRLYDVVITGNKAVATIVHEGSPPMRRPPRKLRRYLPHLERLKDEEAWRIMDCYRKRPWRCLHCWRSDCICPTGQGGALL